MRSTLIIALIAAVALLPAAVVAEDAPVKAARTLLDEHGKAIVHVAAVAKVTASGGGRNLGSRERKIEAMGMLISKDLVLVPYSMLDPTSLMEGRMVQGPQGPMRMTVKADFEEVKVRFADGTETPARIILKDTDLDLGFVRLEPTEDDPLPEKLHTIALDGGAEAKMLEEVIVLARLGKSLDRRPMVSLDRIAAVVKRPRTFYVARRTMLGAPVFTVQGKLLGYCVRRVSSGEDASHPRVILPTADVARIAEQAAEVTDEDDAEAANAEADADADEVDMEADDDGD